MTNPIIPETEWRCNRCGSSDVSQEYTSLIPMNYSGDVTDLISDPQESDCYWCDSCDDECDPVQVVV
jgi:hypothetical protein